MRKQRLSQRPPQFRLDNSHPLAEGLQLAALGSPQNTALVLDSSAYRRNGTVQTASLFDMVYDGQLNRQSLKSLTNGYVGFGAMSPLGAATQVTISMWARRIGASDYALAGKSNTTNDRTSINGWSDGNVYFNVGTGGGFCFGSTTWSGTTWTHLALVFDGLLSGDSARLKAFVNGQQRSLSISQTVPAATQNAGNFEIGRVDGGGSPTTSNAYFADVCAWNRALSTAEISLLADPSNVTLSGLIVPPRRKLFAVPAAVGGGDITVSIGTVSVAATLSDPTVVLTTKTVEIGTISVATSVSDPSVSTGGDVTVNVGTISVAATLSDPTVVKTTKTVEVGTVSVATSVSDPAVVLTSKTVEVGDVSVATSLSDPTVVKTTKTVEVGAVSVATSVADPNVSAGGNVAISIGAVSVAVSVSDPTVSTGGSVSIEIGTVSVAGSLSDPTVVKTTKTVDVGAVSVATSVSDPGVTSGGSVSVNIGAINVGLSASDPEIVLGSVTVNDLRMSVALTLSDPLLVSVPIHESRLHRVRYEARIHRIRRS